MYLLQPTQDGEFTHIEKYGEDIPPYAILSHTWMADHREEVSFKDVAKGRCKNKSGYDKLRFCAQTAARDGLSHFWVDTCCIDKGSSAELQEAINSMFRWYQESRKCYVYLSDVTADAPEVLPEPGEQSLIPSWKPAFRRSRWFTRGWTLQELLAPRVVEFYSKNGVRLGDKTTLRQDIHEITRVRLEALQNPPWPLDRFSVQQRLSWAENRKTTRDEDKAYSILGLFDICMPLLYGEGYKRALRRFHKVRVDMEDDEEPLGAGSKPTTSPPSPKFIVQSEPPRSLDIPEASAKRTASKAFDSQPGSPTDAPDLKRQSVADLSIQSSPMGSERPMSPAELDEFQDESIHQSPGTVQSQWSPTHYIEPKLEAFHNPGTVQSHSNPTYLIEPETEALYNEERVTRVGDMRRWWKTAIARNLDKPEGYSHVALLLLKWADHLDELQTRSEVRELEAVFRDKFYFQTQITELAVATKTQLQLNGCITKFIEDNDGPNNLLVVFYSGHAVYSEFYGHLRLSATGDPARARGLAKDASANWDKAESILRSEEVESDVLTILDACYATSNLPKSRGLGERTSKCFELLSACAIDDTTPAPGDWSFTRSLIDHLKDFTPGSGSRTLSTFQLNQRIRLDPRRINNPSYLWTLLNNERHIMLAPLRETPRITAQVQPYTGRLTLSFNLRDEELNEQQIESLARGLAELARKKTIVGIRAIDWVSMQSAPPNLQQARKVALAKYAFGKWRKWATEKRV